ncbi:hypothetical protein OGAPHI_004021 [Ogataea philodendri]|uniref:RNA helicase n=1 Tax=Ogataea philodendri TaxID=1378263 RepID=A0A9P8P5E5_9ASCO|nr:uncharacterized protein OGAPHI_004021 [Ogataea philodendri]KAH3665833.1 hypothetical protein OGAPHI_004021 [Ogataea philodendri]
MGEIRTGRFKRRRRDFEDDLAEQSNVQFHEEVDTSSTEQKEPLKAELDDPTELRLGNRIRLENDVPRANFEDLRRISRQEYLSKREERQVLLLQAELQDFEWEIEQIGWDRLTTKEQQEYKFKKEIFSTIQERWEIEQDMETHYMLPDDYFTEDGKIDKKRKQDTLHSKYNDTAVVDWEADQMRKAVKADTRVPEKEYEFVFDSSQAVEFVSDPVDVERERLEELIAEEEERIKTIDETRKSLPVYQYRDELIKAVQEHQVLIVVGETGSGKTTQLPQYLHEAGFTKDGKKIGCTQPRRVAAMSVATRVADEIGTAVGDKVGYTIRFEDRTSERTILKYMTDGMLLREFLTDPELLSYSAIMIDEAHERTLSTDVLLGLLKDIVAYRPDFKLLISSATMNAQKFSDFFDGAPIFNIPGRRYPVDIFYTSQPEANCLHAAITTVFQIHLQQDPGDILVFLTGQDEIESMADNLAETCLKLGDQIPELVICPIYANLPSDQQRLIFEPTPEGARKVVLATNIAETSLTIDGIVYVVDTGFVKENVFNPSTGMESLEVKPCSKASADQRAGRAGRLGPGKCYRLYTKWAYLNELAANPTPEILRSSLASVVLLLLSLGITDLLNFDFIDKPAPDTLIKALELIYALGGLNENGELTKVGRRMAEFPTEPMMAKTLLTSSELHCCQAVLSVVAMLQEAGSIFYRPRERKEQADKARQQFVQTLGGDHLTLLDVWTKFVENGHSVQWCRDNYVQYKSLLRVRSIREQLERMCERMGLLDNETDLEHDRLVVGVMKSVVAGFFVNAAQLSKTGDAYRTMKKNQAVWIHPSSVLFGLKPPPKLLIYNELVLTSKEFMRTCIPVHEKWLREYAPHYYSDK